MPKTAELEQKLDELANNTKESKTKRLQILVTPTMYDTLKAAASSKKDLSVNRIVNDALRQYFLGKGEDVE